MIEGWPAAAMSHAWDEEDAAPFGHFLGAAIGCGK